MHKEEGNVGDANEGPFLIGPEHNYWTSLRGLARNVKVGEADTTQVGSQTNEDVPARMTVVNEPESSTRTDSLVN